MADTLPDILAEAGLRPKRMTPGHTEKLRCPRCEGGRTRELSLALSIDQDGEGATWCCHRGSCGWQGGKRTTGARSGTQGLREAPRPVQTPTAHAPDEQHNPGWLADFFADRGIGAETTEVFSVYATRRRFPDPIGESDAIVFPYTFDRRLVNRKYRPHPRKTPQLQDRNALPTLFNIDAIDAPDEVIWVEGELDVMAMHEAGFPQAISLKDGAPAQLRAEDDPARTGDKRFAALATHAELLGKVGRFVLAGDRDAPGLVLREELARRLGRHRCWTVDWPEGCKDAGDVLRLHGREAIQAAIAAAQPWPIDGLQRIQPGALLRLRHGPPPPVLTTGSRASDAILKLPGDGRLIVVTGIPNHGKSSWLMFVSTHLMVQHGRRFLVFSPEMAPFEHYVAASAQVLTGKSFWPRRGLETMSDAEIEYAETWLRERLTMLVSDAEDQAPTLDWIIDRARLTVLREGITDLVIDPWNEVEHQRGAMTETEYTGRSLQRLRSFANRHGANVWIVAHPTKQFPSKPGEKLSAPGLYEISGGANWANKCDLGLTVHTPRTVTEIHVTKARFARWGRKGSKAELEFDPVTGRYASPIAALIGSEAE